MYERSEGDPDVMGTDDIKMMFKYLMMADKLAGSKNPEVKELLDKVKDFPQQDNKPKEEEEKKA